MRVAVSGSHCTGKSSLIAAFLGRRPEYAHEPEAYEALADDIPATAAEGPSLEGLEALLQYTVSVVAGHEPGACVVFERCPVDYLAYAAASGDAWGASAANDFVETHLPAVRASVHHLDLIAFLPVSSTGPIVARAGEDEALRSRVDEALRRALVDDEHDLFGNAPSPMVVELSPVPGRQLSDLLRLTSGAGRE